MKSLSGLSRQRQSAEEDKKVFLSRLLKRPRDQRKILFASFVLVKVLVLLVVWTNFDFGGKTSPLARVYAEEEIQQPEGEAHTTPPATPESSEGNDPEDLLRSIRKEREVLKNLEASLREREQQIREKEVRLERIEAEIEKKLETLSQLQTFLQELIQEKKRLDNETLKKLARVYQSTPPEQAGLMLSMLDVKLAAEILIRMDGRKAGKIWGYVDPKKATQISSEISKLK